MIIVKLWIYTQQFNTLVSEYFSMMIVSEYYSIMIITHRNSYTAVKHAGVVIVFSHYDSKTLDIYTTV